jgi:hypothetical protein
LLAATACAAVLSAPDDGGAQSSTVGEAPTCEFLQTQIVSQYSTSLVCTHLWPAERQSGAGGTCPEGLNSPEAVAFFDLFKSVGCSPDDLAGRLRDAYRFVLRQVEHSRISAER